jgi:hypothetical protein
VGVLLEEVMLHFPHEVDAHAVGDLDLFERVLQQPVLAVLLPRTWQLVLVEDAELHLRLQRDPVAGVMGSIR